MAWGRGFCHCSSPDQIFRARPADYWTLSLWNWGHGVVRVNLGGNYIISYIVPAAFALASKKICKLAISDNAQRNLLTWAIWLVRQHVDTDYAPLLPVNVSRPYFSTRPQGAREKLCLGTRLLLERAICFIFSCIMSYARATNSLRLGIFNPPWMRSLSPSSHFAFNLSSAWP